MATFERKHVLYSGIASYLTYIHLLYMVVIELVSFVTRDISLLEYFSEIKTHKI